jgi:NADH dehydrogenase
LLTTSFEEHIMKQQILVIGAGFGGVWSALSAARLLDMHNRKNVEITLLAPQAELRIRPRFYETDVHKMFAPLDGLFDSVGVRFDKPRPRHARRSLLLAGIQG